MSYLRIRKFWDYQNADAWKKAGLNKRGPKHPPWCKLYLYRDDDMDDLPTHVRLVWFELLRLATEHSNAIPNKTERIAKQISMEHGEVVEAIATLLKGAWIQETKSPRRSREILEIMSPKITDTDKERTTAVGPAFGNLEIPANGYGLEGAIVDLIRQLPDRDGNTEGVIRALVRKHKLGEGAVRTAIEASKNGARSPTRVAVSELKRLAALKA